MRAIAPQRGNVPIFGKTIHGADLRITSTKERVSAVTSGATRRTFMTVRRRSWRYPRAKMERCCAGQTRSVTKKTPMIASVSGPTMTTRRLVRDWAKAAPPQRWDQPITTRTTAMPAIEHAGR